MNSRKRSIRYLFRKREKKQNKSMKEKIKMRKNRMKLRKNKTMEPFTQNQATTKALMASKQSISLRKCTRKMEKC